MTERKARPNPAAAALRAMQPPELAQQAGKARMAQLTAAERQALARKAIRARWAKARRKAT